MKKKFLIISIIIALLILVTGRLFFLMPLKINKVILSDEIINDNRKIMTIEISNNNFLGTKCRINNEKWVEPQNNKCTFEVSTGKYQIEIKNLFKSSKITEDIVINGVKSIALEGEKIYLAVEESLKLNTIIETIGQADTTLTWKTNNPEIVSVEDGIVRGLKTGEAKVTVYAKNNKSYTTNIIVTDLIKPMEINNSRTVIPCNIYSEEDAVILDDILKTRVEIKGEGTRAAVIEAARFLTLSFKYKIPYFFESGRLETYGKIRYVDGEGRYYKKGLYISESKKDDILASFVGPSIWGCPLTNYDNSYGWGIGVKYPNGLDCSGFITWVFLNAGIDVGDIGAGMVSGIDDMSDVGEMHELTYEYANSKEYKVGDLIARDGHTAVIAGIDDEYIYIAESLLKGVVMEKFSYTDPNSKLYRLYGYINTLDNFYKSEGIYDNMW